MIDVDQADLLRALQTTAMAIDKAANKSILEHVHLHYMDGILHVTGTDLDTELTCSIPVIRPRIYDWDICVPAEFMNNVVAAMQGGIGLRLRDGRLHIVGDNYVEADVGTLPAKDFPRIKVMPEAPTKFTLPQSLLAGSLDAVAHAMNREDTRYYLNGVYMHVVNDSLRFVATDGHRLAMDEVPKPAMTASELRGSIIPRRAVNILRKLLRTAPGSAEIAMQVSDARMAVEIGPISIVTKLIDENYPDYPRVLPTNSEIILTIAPDKLRQASERMRTINGLNKEYRPVVLGVAGGAARMSLRTADDDTFQMDLDGTGSGPPSGIAVGLQPKYLAQMTEHLDADYDGDLTIAWDQTPGKVNPPVLFKLTKRPGWTGIIMPMRI